jgi:hypothetical protein
MADVDDVARNLVVAFLSHGAVADRFVSNEKGSMGAVGDPTETGGRIGELYAVVRSAVISARKGGKVDS